MWLCCSVQVNVLILSLPVLLHHPAIEKTRKQQFVCRKLKQKSGIMKGNDTLSYDNGTPPDFIRLSRASHLSLMVSRRWFCSVLVSESSITHQFSSVSWCSFRTCRSLKIKTHDGLSALCLLSGLDTVISNRVELAAETYLLSFRTIQTDGTLRGKNRGE